MDEKHPTKPWSDSKGRFTKGNTMAKQGHGVKLTGVVHDRCRIENLLPSCFCPNCGSIMQLSHSVKHYTDCNIKLPKDIIDAKYDEYQKSLRWAK